MRLIEENRKLCYGFAAAVVVLLVLWPSFREGRPAVVSFFKPEFGRLEATDTKNAEEIRKYYSAGNPKMMEEIARGRECNDALGAEFTTLRDYVLFIPAMPFRIPYYEPQPGLKFLDIQTKAHFVELVRYARLRDVEIEDPFFGLNMNGVPPEKEKLPLLTRQLAVIDDLCRKAIDSGVRKIGKVEPMGPVESGALNKNPFLKLYPVRMVVTGPFDSIMAFVNSLDGIHGKVTSAGRKIPADGDRVVAGTPIEISLGSKHGLREGSELTIFDVPGKGEVPDKDDGVRYKGRARVTQLAEDKCMATVPADSLPAVEDKELENRKIKEGDIATTNFYTLLDMKIEANRPNDETSLVNRISAIITVAGVGLLQDAQGVSMITITDSKQGNRPNKIRGGGY